MKDGYYLSTYFEMNEVANLARISGRHDFNVSLWKKTGGDIELIHYWELERRTGFKQHRVALYDVGQAKEIINHLLSEYNLTLDDMKEIWGTSELDDENSKFNTEDFENLTFHSLSHLFSAILLDSDKFFNDKIIGLAVDGGPDNNVDCDAYTKPFYTGSIIDNGKIKLFPIPSPGYMWMAAFEHYGLREGTLMALSSASKSRSNISMGEPLLIYDKFGAQEFNSVFLDYVKKIDSLQAEDEGKLFNFFDPNFTIEENKISMVMKKIQELSIKTMEITIDKLLKEYNLNASDYILALSGGYALNCPTNSHLMKKYKFKGFMAPPCVNDSGMSLGIALYAFYKKCGKFNFKFKNAFYGDRDDNLSDYTEIFKDYIKSISTFDVGTAAKDVLEAPIVWFNSRAEVGPRALGARSILGNPADAKTKDILNAIKKRQWWRPVAPIILEDEVSNWFYDAYPSPYMLHTFNIREDKAKIVPAILHLDNSARIQTINKDDSNKLIYQLLCELKRRTGIPIICNTSLNDAKEPIINRADEALNFALRKGIHIIYINGKRVELTEHDKYMVEEPSERPLHIVKSLDNSDVKERISVLNPHNVPNDVLQLYYTTFELHSRYDLKKEEDIKKLLVHARFWKVRLD